MRNALIIFLFLIQSFSVVHSQENDSVNVSNQFGKITGIFVDSKDSTALPNADCKLYKEKDTVIFMKTRTDTAGHFSLDTIPFGKYWFEIELAGYDVYINNKISLDENNPVVSLDTIKSSKQTIETGEILVEGEKPVFTFEGDKKVFHASESLTSKGGTVLDVLKKVPMVDVDINDNVTLRGSKNVIIWIDGKPNRYMNLKQIPAEGVDKVELITNPPAKYASEGVTGIINIVTLKTNALGINGYLNTGVGTKDKYNGGVNLNFRKNKTALFTNGYYGIYNYTSASSGSTQYLAPVISYLNSDGSYNGKSYYYYGVLGTEYDVMKNSVIGMEGYYSGSTYTNTSLNTYKNLDLMSNLTSFYTRNKNGSGTWKDYSISGYYDLKFNEKGKELTGDVTYYGNENKSYSNLSRQDYDSLSVPINNTPLSQRDSIYNKTSDLNVQADYSYPFGKNNMIETGFRGTLRTNDMDYRSDTLDYNIGGYVDNLNIANHFKHTEWVNAVYFMFGSKIKEFSYKLGLRIESTGSKSELLSGNQTYQKNYTDFFPSVSLSLKIGEANQIQLSYSRRITRPNFYRLNPFLTKYDIKFYYTGNPLLNPEFADSYELSYMLFNKYLTVTPSAFFRRMHDIISNYGYLTDSGATVTTYRNASGANAYGLDLILTSRTFEWLNLNATFSFYNTKFDEALISDYAAEEGFSWQANIRAFFSFTKMFKLELYYNYSGKKVNAQGINLPSQNLDIGFNVSLFDETADINLRVSDVFKTMQWASNFNGAGYNSSYKSQYDSRVVWLSVSYRFGNTKDIYKKKQTKGNQNESNDQMDNNQGK